MATGQLTEDQAVRAPAPKADYSRPDLTAELRRIEALILASTQEPKPRS